MLARRDHDYHEFVLGENDVMEHQGGQQVRITLKGSDNFGRHITCALFMTPAQLVRLKRHFDDALAEHETNSYVDAA
jgi:hypothetical protein